MSEHYDLVVVGAGSAGLSAAGFAARLGARVAIVERDRVGGDCTWNGCVPSKALIKSAKIAHQINHAEKYGLATNTAKLDFKATLARVHEVIRAIEGPVILASCFTERGECGHTQRCSVREPASP